MYFQKMCNLFTKTKIIINSQNEIYKYDENQRPKNFELFLTFLIGLTLHCNNTFQSNVQ